MPADFFSRNYCKALAHNELAAYVDLVKTDARLQATLKTLFATKGPLGAGHSNAITLWVYEGYPLEHLDLDGVEDISFADLSGAKIKHVIISKDHYTSIEYRHDLNYESSDTAGGSGVVAVNAQGNSRNSLVGQIGIYF